MAKVETRRGRGGNDARAAEARRRKAERAEAAAREASAEAARRLAQQSEALELRIAGGSYRAIARQMGVGVRQAYEMVQAGLAELETLRTQDAERLRELELERCDRMQLALGRKVTAGEERAIRAAVAVMDRRARYLGLDAPSKVEVSDPSKLVERLRSTRVRAPMPGDAGGA